jgi:hypothetical protein
MDTNNKINLLNTIWSIKSEFSNLNYQKIELDNRFIKYISKWINIMLLRDDSFFQSQLNNYEYIEFIDKINQYKNSYGSAKENISLYFTEYNFSEELTNKILTIRNHYGIILLIMLAYPFDIFENDLSLISKELKKLEQNFSLRNLLQEVGFDLGCSSYALGKIYDFLTKTCDNLNEDINDEEFLNYSNNVVFKAKELLTIFEKQSEGYNIDEINKINFIKTKQTNYLPLDFVISNRLLFHFIKEFFKF